MNELLQKLLEAEILTEDTKTELEEAFKSQLDEAIVAAKEEAAADVRTELTEQWITERDTLIEAIDTKVGEYLEGEVDELKEDIERFRDLEAEMAEKLVEAKAAMSSELKTDLKDLVEKIDAFLEIRLAAEVEELREDITAVRENEFGRKIFEAFKSDFMSNYADEDSAESTLRETEQRLADVEKQLEESERARASLDRDVTMEKVLSPLSGRSRDVMEAILKNVATDALEEGYKTFIGRVIRETSNDADSSEKEGKVLAEGAESDKKAVTEKAEVTVKTGDSTETIIEESTDATAAAQRKAYLQKLAGITA